MGADTSQGECKVRAFFLKPHHLSLCVLFYRVTNAFHIHHSMEGGICINKCQKDYGEIPEVRVSSEKPQG